MDSVNVKVSRETHKDAVAHVSKEGKLLYRFVQDAINEKIEREKKKEKVQYFDNGQRKN